jgi:hypothetical protein
MNRIESIHVAPTTERKAEPGRFQRALEAAAVGAANGLAATVEVAAPYVPGGTVVSAAVRSVANQVAASTSGAPAPGGAPSGTDMLDQTRALQQEAQQFNLQYLQLQERMQRESREFQAVSNVMKVRHDSAKAAISNIH